MPVIEISACTSGQDAEKSLAAGADAFLPKPVDYSELLTQVGALLKLTWIYEPQETEPMLSGLLVPPPPEEVAILHRLALLGNMRDIVPRTAHVAGLGECYQPFADELRRLAKGYRSKAILALVERDSQTRDVS